MFPLLDQYMIKPVSDIESEYNNIINKPEFGRDLDHLLLIIVHDFINNPTNFNNYEVKIISLLLKLRRGNLSLLFVNFFPVMKGEINNYFLIDRETEVKNIYDIFKTSGKLVSPEIVNFESLASSTPHFKYENLCSFASPSTNERYSFSDDLPEIPFHFTNCSSPSSSIDTGLFKPLTVFPLANNSFIYPNTSLKSSSTNQSLHSI